MMRTKLVGVLGAVALAMVSGCASIEPDPCTPQWVDWKKERILSEFARDYRSEIRTLQDLRSTLEGGASGGGVTQALGLALALPKLGDMVEAFVDRTVPEVEAALMQCGFSSGAEPLFADMLRGEGLDEETVKVVEQLGLFVEAAASGDK